MAFEEAFEIEIPDEDAEKIQTVKDVVDYIQESIKPMKNVLTIATGRESLTRRVVVTGVGAVSRSESARRRVKNLLAGKRVPRPSHIFIRRGRGDHRGGGQGF